MLKVARSKKGNCIQRSITKIYSKPIKRNTLGPKTIEDIIRKLTSMKLTHQKEYITQPDCPSDLKELHTTLQINDSSGTL